MSFILLPHNVFNVLTESRKFVDLAVPGHPLAHTGQALEEKKFNI